MFHLKVHTKKTNMTRNVPVCSFWTLIVICCLTSILQRYHSTHHLLLLLMSNSNGLQKHTMSAFYSGDWAEDVIAGCSCCSWLYWCWWWCLHCVYSVDWMWDLLLEMQFIMKNTRWRKRAKHSNYPSFFLLSEYESISKRLTLNTLCPALLYSVASSLYQIYGSVVCLVYNSVKVLIDSAERKCW